MINKLKAFINGIKAIPAKAITYVSKEKVRPILNANYFQPFELLHIFH